MNIFLYGFANSGKTTFFNLICKKASNPSPFYSKNIEPTIGTASIIDRRVYLLKEIYNDKKENFTKVQIEDFLGVLNEKKQINEVLERANKSEIILYIIRNFENSEVLSPISEVNPLKEFFLLYQELQLKDLQMVETRMKNIKDLEKKGKKQDPKEIEFLENLKEKIENSKDLSQIKEEKNKFPHLSFLSLKPFYVLINSDERKKAIELENHLKNLNIPYSYFFGKIEEEALELGEEEEKWLSAYGIREPLRKWFLFELFKSLGFIFFLTIGEEEIKSWLIKDGTNAYSASGKIHTDIQKGFIKAEVINFNEFIKIKDFNKAKEMGILKIEGKDYKIKDGDIIYFKFHI